MILPAGLLLLPFVLANLGFWGCLTGTELVTIDFLSRVSCCYMKSFFPDDYSHDYDYDYDDEPRLPDLPEYRLVTGSAPGSSFRCWPSKGGIYMLPNSHIVQRQFLGIDRHVPSILRPEVSIEVEDAFCHQLRKLGAQWWESESQYYDPYEAQLLGRPARDKSVLHVGWPASGGVWALHADQSDAIDKGYGIIYNSITMEEQCEIIQELGGTFYQDPKDCPYLDLPEN